ncbi:MAG: methyl-accepting chemotaxis protein [Candidatus Zixiibacteriota bacterium]
MSWGDVKIAWKLYIGFGVVLCLTAALGIISISSIKQLRSCQARLEFATQLAGDVKDLAVARRDFMLTGGDTYAEKARELVEKMSSDISTWLPRFTDRADGEMLTKAQQALGEYSTGLVEYISEYQASKTEQGNMTALGSKLHSLAGSSRSRKAQQFLVDLQRVRMAAMDLIIFKTEAYDAEFDRLIKPMLASYAGEDRELVAALHQYHESQDRFAEAMKGQTDELAQLRPLAEQVIESIVFVRKSLSGQMATAQSMAITFSIGFAVSAILLGLAVAFFISRGISRPIAAMSKVATSISVGDISQEIDIRQNDEVGKLAKAFKSMIAYMEGMSMASERIARHDLSVDVKPKSERDALGKSFQTMVANLSGMIRQLSDNARELVSAATEISASSDLMSKGAKDQSDQVIQVSTAVEEMTATIVESSRNAGDASEAAKGAAATATAGGKVVGQSIAAMQQITTTVRESADSIGRLASSAEQIGQIIGVIDDIADQTNLLALNAAIEAARAGEQGRGFAVVADEVRKLAERTGKATGEITMMIKGIQKETTEAVRSMEDGITVVDKGRELADQAGSSLSEIVAMAQRVTDMIEQMAKSAEEQSTASEMIAKNVEHISGVTRETATGAEQSAQASVRLSQQAEGLQRMVEQFSIEGSNARAMMTAKEDHNCTMGLLRDISHGEAPAATWEHHDHKSCKFGKFYFDEGMTVLGKDADYRAMEPHHAEIHRLATGVLAAIARNDEAGARKLYDEAAVISRRVGKDFDKVLELLSESRTAIH